MLRRLLSLVLVLQLLIPARAWCLLTTHIAQQSASPTEISSPPVQACPCSGNAVCKCSGGCCSVGLEDETVETASNDKPESPDEGESDQKNHRGSSPRIHCRCHPADTLQPEGENYSSVRGLSICYFQPPIIGLLVNQSESWPSLATPVDTPPPRNPI